MRFLPRRLALLLGLVLASLPAPRACIWDSDTLWSEKRKQPDLAALILGKSPPETDKAFYRTKLAALLASPRPEDPAWLNDVAGAYLRLGEPQKAVDLLAPRVAQLTNDYGLHANLGTAYHLLGRYADAERHIARDLELNPDAHFGLEKFHLALLQYLLRDVDWKQHRLYVDEFSYALQRFRGSILDYGPYMAQGDEVEFPHYATNAPGYRAKWNLAEDPKLTEGLSYMASLNPREPAVFEMLGVLSWRNRDLNLAAAAFERAIALNSPKAALLQTKVDSIREHISKARYEGNSLVAYLIVALGALTGAAIIALMRWRRRLATRKAT